MKKKAHSLLALLLSLSLTLSLCAPAAGAAELSALAGEGDRSAVTVSDTEGEENASEESTSTEPEDASPEESAQGDASADGETSGPDMESQEENAPQDSAPEQPSEEEQEEQEQTSEPQEAEHRTVRSAEQLSDFLAQEFTGDYFVEAVVDTKRDRVSVDGERVSLTDAFGAEADREAIFDSPEAAKAYFEDTPYEAESVGGGKVVVTSPWQTCRIVVSAKALDGDYGAETVVEYPKYHQFVLQFPDKETTQAAYESLSARYTCYVDQILSADETLQDGETWGGAYMGTNTLKSAGTLSDADTIQVAIIDSGCWADNSFFEGRSFSDKSRSFPDNDGPFVDVKSGYHGTHVAGILHTLTPANVELMILRVWYKSGDKTITSFLLADTAIRYALENGAEVINFSMGTQDEYSSKPDTSTFLDQGLSMARDMGVPVVCSAGNLSKDVNTNYPACNEDTIAVSAINRSSEFAYTWDEEFDEKDRKNLGKGDSGSSYGAGIDFCAPGVNVVSAYKTGTTSKNGTSMAAPHIAAAFAWLRLEDPSADWDGLYNRLKGLCTDLGEAGKDELYGWGCPNLSALSTSSTSGHVHQWTGTVFEPDCDSRGYTVYECSGCPLLRMSNYKGPAHSFDESGVCTKCGKKKTTACGEGMTWSYSSATETLTISGSGTVTTASWEELYPQQFIRRVYLPDASGVADGLFAGYLSLESVQMGDNLTTLGKKCFSGCTALKKIILPDGLTTIGDGALCGCTALATIDNRSSAFTVVDDCLLYNKNKTRLITCGGAWNGGTLTVPNTVREIGERALEGVNGLTELRLSPSLKKIGTGAFQSCANLERVYARSSDTTVGSNPFGSDTATVYVSEGCTGWEDHDALGKKLRWASYPGDLSRWTMSLNDTNWAYTGSTRRPGIILSSGSITARNYGSDSNYSDYFTYRYTNNTALGLSTDGENAPTATVTGVGIYYGTQSLPFTIALSAPVVNAPVLGDEGITVSWEEVYGADWYQVIRKDGEDGAWINLPGAVIGKDSWINLPGAVIGKDSSGENTPKVYSWTDTALLSGHSYTYSVWCYTNDYKTADTGVRARYRSKYKYKANQPSVLFLSATRQASAELVDGASVRLSWSAVDGADFYRVLRQDESAEGVTQAEEGTEQGSTGPVYEWVTVAENVTATQWTDASPNPGKNNVYAIQAVAQGGTESALSALLSVDVPAVPTLVSAVNEGTGVRVKWKKQTGVAKYRVLCKTGSGGWKKVADTTSTSALVKTSNGSSALKSGTTYAFTVRGITADGKSYTTGGNAEGKSVVFVCAPSLSSAKNAKKQKLNAAWKKVSGVTGYQVQIALNQKFTSGKKTVNLKGAGTLKYTFKSLKKKKTYYVRLRSYKSVSGKTHWSTWSGVKKVAIKK